MENNDNNYQIVNKNPQPDFIFQQGSGNYVQPYNMGNMQPYHMRQPSVTYNVTTPQPVTESNLPDAFKPISPWGYLGYSMLFSIPIVGIVMLFIYAFGGTSNKNLRNYARSYFCIILLYVIIFIILLSTGVLSALLSGRR